jgi:hypothetical protein
MVCCGTPALAETSATERPARLRTRCSSPIFARSICGFAWSNSFPLPRFLFEAVQQPGTFISARRRSSRLGSTASTRQKSTASRPAPPASRAGRGATPRRPAGGWFAPLISRPGCHPGGRQKLAKLTEQVRKPGNSASSGGGSVRVGDRTTEVEGVKRPRTNTSNLSYRHERVQSPPGHPAADALTAHAKTVARNRYGIAKSKARARSDLDNRHVQFADNRLA